MKCDDRDGMIVRDWGYDVGFGGRWMVRDILGYVNGFMWGF